MWGSHFSEMFGTRTCFGTRNVLHAKNLEQLPTHNKMTYEWDLSLHMRFTFLPHRLNTYSLKAILFNIFKHLASCIFTVGVHLELLHIFNIFFQSECVAALFSFQLRPFIQESTHAELPIYELLCYHPTSYLIFYLCLLVECID